MAPSDKSRLLGDQLLDLPTRVPKSLSPSMRVINFGWKTSHLPPTARICNKVRKAACYIARMGTILFTRREISYVASIMSHSQLSPLTTSNQAMRETSGGVKCESDSFLGWKCSPNRESRYLSHCKWLYNGHSNFPWLEVATCKWEKVISGERCDTSVHSTVPNWLVAWLVCASKYVYRKFLHIANFFSRFLLHD